MFPCIIFARAGEESAPIRRYYGNHAGVCSPSALIFRVRIITNQHGRGGSICTAALVVFLVQILKIPIDTLVEMCQQILGSNSKNT